MHVNADTQGTQHGNITAHACPLGRARLLGPRSDMVCAGRRLSAVRELARRNTSAIRLLFATNTAASHHSRFAGFLLPIPPALYGPAVPVWLDAANIAAGMVGLLVTVRLEIPRHHRLERNGKSEATISELIRYNWPRTLSITSQAAIAALMLLHVFAGQ